MRGGTYAASLAAAVALALPAGGSAQETAVESFDFGGFRNVLPGGQGETVNAQEFAAFQASGNHRSAIVDFSAVIKTDPKNLENCYGCYTRVAKRYFGATADASFDLIRTSRFTPYLKSGVGLYYTKLGTQPSNLSAVINDPIYARSGFSFGVNEGLGFKTRIGSHELFVEQMIHLIDLRRFDKGFAPLNIGVRF